MATTALSPTILGVKISDSSSVYEAPKDDFKSLEEFINSDEFNLKINKALGADVSGSIQLNIGLDGSVKVKKITSKEWITITLNDTADNKLKKQADAIKDFTTTRLQALGHPESTTTEFNKDSYTKTYTKVKETPTKKPQDSPPEESSKPEKPSSSSISKTSSIAPIGIKGAGNNCWIKSLTQMLNLNPTLRKEILIDLLGENHPLAKYDDKINAEDLRKAIIDAAPDKDKHIFRKDSQCDPAEALQILLSGKDTSQLSTKIKETHTIQHYTDKNATTTSGSPYFQEGQANESTYLIPLNTEDSIKDALKNHFNEDYSTTAAKNQKYIGDEKHRVTKTERKFENSPQKMMFQFKRFNSNASGKDTQKIKKDIEVPLELNMKDFIESNSEDHKMALKSFIVHEGNTLDSGHYSNYTLIDGQWYEINEEKVRKISNREAETKAKQSYLVYYEKKESSSSSKKTETDLQKTVQRYQDLLEIIDGKHTQTIKNKTDGLYYGNLLITAIPEFFTSEELKKIYPGIKISGILSSKTGEDAVTKDPSLFIKNFEAKRTQIEQDLREAKANLNSSKPKSQQLEAIDEAFEEFEKLNDSTDNSLKQAFDQVVKSLGFAIFGDPSNRKAQTLSPSITSSSSTDNDYVAKLILSMSSWLHKDSPYYERIKKMADILRKKNMKDELKKLEAELDRISQRAPGLEDEIKLVKPLISTSTT